MKKTISIEELMNVLAAAGYDVEQYHLNEMTEVPPETIQSFKIIDNGYLPSSTTDERIANTMLRMMTSSFMDKEGRKWGNGWNGFYNAALNPGFAASLITYYLEIMKGETLYSISGSIFTNCVTRDQDFMQTLCETIDESDIYYNLREELERMSNYLLKRNSDLFTRDGIDAIQGALAKATLNQIIFPKSSLSGLSSQELKEQVIALNEAYEQEEVPLYKYTQLLRTVLKDKKLTFSTR